MMAGTPEGRCLNCGTVYHGWILLDPRQQTCSICGGVLLIENTEGAIIKDLPAKFPGKVKRPDKSQDDS